MIAADAVVSLPRLRGPFIEGLPADADGFIPINANARVVGVPHVFAAGDATDEPIKQGGLATQQADAAAETIAAEAGAVLIPRPYRRILRGVVLTGERPLYLRRDLDEATGDHPPAARGAAGRLARPAVVAPGQDRRPLPHGLRRRGRPSRRATGRPAAAASAGARLVGAAFLRHAAGEELAGTGSCELPPITRLP